MLYMKNELFKKINRYDTIDSTNLEAKRFLKNNVFDSNFVILAKTQTKGMGRRHNRWYSPPGGLWCSLVLKEQIFQSNITLFTGIILHKALRNLLPNSPLKIKWPNDILWKNKKLAGILTETSHSSTIIGVGLNLNQTELDSEIAEIATSVRIETEKIVDKDKFLHTFLDQFTGQFIHYKEDNLQDFLQYYRENSYLTGKLCTIETGRESEQGVVQGVDTGGALVIKVDDEKRKIISADTIEIH